MSLDHQRFLTGDPLTAMLFREAARQWARRYFDDAARIDSVVQDALLEMLERLRAGEQPAHDRLAYWIYQCTHNAVRREQTRMRHSDAVPYESNVHGPAPLDMSEAMQLRMELQLFERALYALVDKTRRQIFEARVYGETYREIAAAHGVSETNARKSVSQVRKFLRGETDARDKREYLERLMRRFGRARQPSSSPPPARR